MWLFVLIILVLIGGIVYVDVQFHAQKKSRRQFLNELTNLVDGQLEELNDEKSTCRILFEFMGRKYIFEDIEEAGFKERLNKSFLKVPFDTKLNLIFSEKKTTRILRPDIVMTSQIPDEPIDLKEESLKVPKDFEVFQIVTNNVPLVNRLFQHAKILSFLRECKNFDSRGYPFMSLRIEKGLVILEFQSLGSFAPSLKLLYKDVHAIQDYLKFLDLIVNTLQ